MYAAGPLDFDLSEEQRLFADSTRRFLANECDLSKVRTLAETDAGFDADWWHRAAELGWISLLVDEDVGGLGLGDEGVLYLGLVAEEMGRTVSPGPLLPCSLVASTLSRSGNPKQRTEILPTLISGEATASWCFAEGGQAWSADSVMMEAERIPGGYRLCGAKWPVEAAAEARYLLLTARCDGQLTQFLLPADTPGVIVEPLTSLDLVRRFARIRFDGVEVDDTCLVGAEGDTADDVEHQLQIGLGVSCAESVGAVARVFEFTLQWAFERYSFGRPLASYQALKHRFADMRTWLEGCQATTSAALRAIAEQAEDSACLARVAKAFIGDYAPEILQECVQMHGGIGVTWDHDIHLYLRRVTCNRAILGAPHEQRKSIADLLKF